MSNLGLREIEMQVLDTVHAVYELTENGYTRVSQYYSRFGDAERKRKQQSLPYYSPRLLKVLSFELYLEQASIR
jgi:hypothetical protein